MNIKKHIKLIQKFNKNKNNNFIYYDYYYPYLNI